MQTHHGPNPDTTNHYLEVYEALDTIVEDIDALAATRQELLPSCADVNDLATLNAEVARDATLIEERRMYVLGTVIGRATLDLASVRAASLAYVTKSDSPEGQQNAARRVATYNGMLAQAWYRGAVPPTPRETALGDPGEATRQDVRVYGRTDPVTGQRWISLTDARTVEYVEPVREDAKVLADYEIIRTHVNAAGETVAVIRPQGMPERSVVFPADSQVWRINEEGRLELFIPPDRSSVGEFEVEREGDLFDVRDRLRRLAVQAAGADLPNIATTFDTPTGNPRPYPVAKQN